MVGATRYFYAEKEVDDIISSLKRGEISKICNQALKEHAGGFLTLESINKKLVILNQDRIKLEAEIKFYIEKKEEFELKEKERIIQEQNKEIEEENKKEEVRKILRKKKPNLSPFEIEKELESIFNAVKKISYGSSQVLN